MVNLDPGNLPQSSPLWLNLIPSSKMCCLNLEIEALAGQDKRGVDKLGLDLAIKERDFGAGLNAITKAVFYAVSPEQLSKALALRCRLLHEIKLFDEAIEDGLMTLRLPCPKSEIGNVHICLARSYQIKSMLIESKAYYVQAIKIFNENIERNSDSIRKANKGLEKCFSAGTIEMFMPKWKCFRSEPPNLREIESEITLSTLERTENDSLCPVNSKLLSVPNNALRLKRTHLDWTMELAHNVSTGDILLVEKPWAMSLWKERTKYCYFCCKRCHILKPCSGCPHVGFCGDECQRKTRNHTELQDGGNKHIYDCQAFNRLAKVPPNELLDYICSTGSYTSAKGHQAFKGAEETRDAPPAVFDPSDYSSIAFLSSCSEKRNCHQLQTFTEAAIFLTYCFYPSSLGLLDSTVHSPRWQRAIDGRFDDGLGGGTITLEHRISPTGGELEESCRGDGTLKGDGWRKVECGEDEGGGGGEGVSVGEDEGEGEGEGEGTVAEITLQRTDTTHDLSSESREAIARSCTTPSPPPHHHLPRTSPSSPILCTLSPRIYHSLALPSPWPTFAHRSNPLHRFSPPSPSHRITRTHPHTHPHTLLTTLFSGSRISTRSSGVLISRTLELGSVLPQ
ncbi:unnamed protein product [Hymenolepis diminuta]|uniref:MYND-type domain-containing protein n=1 Tax=Hymenolepis diminuta TaxID=6216 RepID=A0A564XY81_HYMDI|nr:unnamed protein product [Hymenolepis diminuta]